MGFRCFHFEMRSKGVVLRSLDFVSFFEELLLFLCIYEMLYSFYALERAFEKITNVCFVEGGLEGLTGIFLGFVFWVSAEMNCCVGVIADRIAFK